LARAQPFSGPEAIGNQLLDSQKWESDILWRIARAADLIMEFRSDSVTRRKSLGVLKPCSVMNVEVVSLKPQRTKEALIATAAIVVEDEGCTKKAGKE
jgi:hypothetical protein